jgi:hypothetical protein
VFPRDPFKNSYQLQQAVRGPGKEQLLIRTQFEVKNAVTAYSGFFAIFVAIRIIT